MSARTDHLRQMMTFFVTAAGTGPGAAARFAPRPPAPRGAAQRVATPAGAPASGSGSGSGKGPDGDPTFDLSGFERWS